MVPRKSRGQITGDEVLQEGLLDDFRAFCRGEDDRLGEVFDRFKKELLEKWASIGEEQEVDSADEAVDGYSAAVISTI